MKTTVEKIINADSAVKDFVKKETNSKLSFRLARFTDKCSSVVKCFTEADRKLIIEKYGIKDGENYQVPKEKIQDYIKERIELLNQEEEFDFTINYSLFENEKVSADFFIKMGDFII